MKPTNSVFLIASGAALIVSGFAYDLVFAGLPYQDPPPELQQRWLYHQRMAQMVMLTGATALGIGCMWRAALWIKRILKRPRLD